MKKRIYLVDFDGTISKKDSFCLFTFFSVNIFSFLKYWAILFFFFPFYTNRILKEKFFQNFKGFDEEKFNSLQLDVQGNQTIEECIRKYISEERLDGENQYETEQFGKQDARKFIRIK